jgi:predicted DNA-binding transcriptional regulator AlpA
MSERRLIGSRELREVVPLSMSQIYRLEATGRFPRRIQIGLRKNAWWYDEVLEWTEKNRVKRAKG